jgi:hypothetical protein
LREDCEARVARDAAFGGSKGIEKADAVGNRGEVKLGIATTRLRVTQARCPRASTNNGEGRKVPAPRVKWQRRGHA